MIRPRRMLVAALLATTALVPVKASAAPVVAVVQGLVAGLSGTALLGGSFLAPGFTTGVAAAGFLSTGVIGAVGGFALKTALGLGLSAVATGLASSSTAQELTPGAGLTAPSERLVNFAQPVSYMEDVYGKVRKGGPYSFTGAADGSRYYGVLLAAHEIDGIEQHYLDDLAVDVDGSGEVTTDPISGYGNLAVYDGGPGQAADADLVANFSEVTSAHDFTGLSWIRCIARRPPAAQQSEIYPNVRHWDLLPVIRGRNKVWDPRDETYKYTANLALVIADAAERKLGAGSVDWDEVAAEADVCDQDVTDRDGNIVKKWEFHGTVPSNEKWEKTRTRFKGAGDVFFYERTDGKVGFRVGRWQAPTLVLTPADFYGLSITEGATDPDTPTEYVARYTEPDRDWVEAPSGVYVHDADARRVRAERGLYDVIAHNQAFRVLRRMARADHAAYRLEGEIKFIGHELWGQDCGPRFARYVDELTGIDVYIEFGQIARTRRGAGFAFEAVTVTPDDFDDDVSDEEPARPESVDVTSDVAVPDVQGFSGAASAGTGGVAVIDYSWTAAGDGYFQQIRFRAPADGLSDWQIVTIEEGQSTYRVTGLIDGATYEAQIRNRTGAGREGDWKPDTAVSVTAVANATAPAAVSDFAAALNGSDVDLSWTSPNDGNYDRALIYRATGSTDFADAALIHTEYGPPSAADNYTDAAPGVGDQSYWIESANGSGVADAANRVGPQTVTVT